jgi:cytochrome c oxidase assembly protein subunit 15
VERLALLLTALTYVLLVLGNLVRSTNSGLSYLTWPLYQGRVIPDREFHVLMEFSHRALAGTVSAVLLVLAGAILRSSETRSRLRGLLAVSIALIAMQIVLGALTVWKLLAPVVVLGHLATGQLFFVSALLMHLTCVREREAWPGGAAEPAGLGALFTLCSLAAFAQILLGGLVSANRAGLAVPTFPTANGSWFPPLTGPVGLQMIHRDGAYVLAALLIYAAVQGRRSAQRKVRASSSALAGMIVVQIVLGALNVLWRIPVWVTALHLATATGILAMCVSTAFRLGSVPAGGHAPAARVAA